MQTQADRRTCIQVITRNMKEKDVDKIKRVNNMQKMIAREREVDGHKHTRERERWVDTNTREREFCYAYRFMTELVQDVDPVRLTGR